MLLLRQQLYWLAHWLLLVLLINTEVDAVAVEKWKNKKKKCDVDEFHGLMYLVLCDPVVTVFVSAIPTAVSYCHFHRFAAVVAVVLDNKIRLFGCDIAFAQFEFAFYWDYTVRARPCVGKLCKRHTCTQIEKQRKKQRASIVRWSFGKIAREMKGISISEDTANITQSHTHTHDKSWICWTELCVCVILKCDSIFLRLFFSSFIAAITALQRSINSNHSIWRSCKLKCVNNISKSFLNRKSVFPCLRACACVFVVDDDEKWMTTQWYLDCSFFVLIPKIVFRNPFKHTQTKPWKSIPQTNFI